MPLQVDHGTGLVTGIPEDGIAERHHPVHREPIELEWFVQRRKAVTLIVATMHADRLRRMKWPCQRMIVGPEPQIARHGYGHEGVDHDQPNPLLRVRPSISTATTNRTERGRPASSQPSAIRCRVNVVTAERLRQIGAPLFGVGSVVRL